MEDFIKNKIENINDFTKQPSISEKLTKENASWKNEYRKRLELDEQIKSLFKNIPIDSNIEKVLEEKVINKEELNKFYENLMGDMEQNPNYKRLFLYYPLELIPSQENNNFRKFNEFYKKTWFELTKEIDIREDFNEGNIEEDEIRITKDLPLTSKALHLLPYLIEKNILNTDEVVDFIEQQNDSTLLNSFNDVLPTLIEKKYINEDNISKLKSSKNIELKNGILFAEKIVNEGKKVEDNIIPLENIILNLENDLENTGNTILDKDKKIERRYNWIKDKKEKDTRDKYSTILKNEFLKNSLTIEEIQKLINETENEDTLITLIQTIEKITIEIGKNEDLLSLLKSNVLQNNELVKESLTQTLERLNNAGLIDLTSFENITLRSQEENLKDTEKEIKGIFSKIGKNEFLKSKVYQAFLLNGSQNKGYSEKNSDIDLSIFIKPNTNLEDRKEIQENLKSLINTQNQNISFMEFWLKENNNNLEIIDFEDLDPGLGDSSITYTLTNPWYGKQEDIKILQEKLSQNYLNNDKNNLYLKNIEHNLLQYRLMHQGYFNKNIKQDFYSSEHKNYFDGDSAFLNPNYRRMATEIYLKKVFLPK